MKHHLRPFFILLTLLLLAGLSSLAWATGGEWRTFLPLMLRQEAIATEFRGLWVTRFDWTTFGEPADPAKIDEIVQNAAAAGFNAIFFQVRGAADAYYTPGLEPWAQRVSGGELGQPPEPLWDPLAYFVQQAHAHNLQLHAYLNVYPVWDRCDAPPPPTSPTHLYDLLAAAHGETDGRLNGLQWDTNDQIHCQVYQRATPASVFHDDHFIAVATDLVTRYAVDGIHLDNVRYGGAGTSCDPVSENLFGADCFSDPAYAQWQRERIDQLVQRLYQEVVPLRPGLWLSAAVWPIYQDKWGWGGTQGYSDYYQDSKAWLAGGYIDSVSPMIYPAVYACPYEGFWTLDKWEILTADFQADSAGRFIIPGIGSEYCTFDEIVARIELARSLGTAGHALFSYGGLLTHGYFDDLAAGPYAEPAVPPTITWHP